MSAFVVSDKHINSMLSFIRSENRYGFIVCHDNKTFSFDLNDNESAKELGQILLDENYRSVNHRYHGDEAEPHKLAFKRVSVISPVQMLKCIQCLNYQSCETDDWDDTLAYKVLRCMSSIAIGKLDGYEEAAWGID